MQAVDDPPALIAAPEAQVLPMPQRDPRPVTGRPGAGPAPPRAAGARAAGDTRARIVSAALQVLREGGISGISARSIARRGGFNQALIFYHFGSVEGLLVEVARSESERRSALYATALREVGSLTDLVAVARRLHDEEFAAGGIAALTQMLAGAGRSDALARGIREALAPWTRLVDETITRLLSATPYADLLPHEDLTAIVTALFLGIELYTGLEPGRDQSSMFRTMESLGALVDALLHAGPPPGGQAAGTGGDG